MQYDVMGKVVESEDANGTKINYSYDAADRVLSATYSDGTPTVSYKYDLIPNGKGALIETSNGVSTSKTTQIDQWGRPTEYQQITDGQTYTSKYSYNLSGALIEEEYPSGRVVKNSFDANGDLARIHGKANSNAAERTYANSFAYSTHNKIQRLKLGNGLWEAGKFNDRLQVTELSLGHSASDTSLWSLKYDYDEALGNGITANTGNVIQQTVNFQGLTEPFVQTYEYDSLYRLTEAKEMAGTTENWKQNLTYDRYGNRQNHNKFINGNPIIHDNKSHPTINQNTNRFNIGQGYEYDKIGNLTKDVDNRNFTFDANNKQTIITNNSGVKIGEYFYDGEGKRVKKKVYDSNQNVIEETIFVYSLGKLAEEYSTAPPSTNPTTNYTITDKVGSPRVLANGEGNIKSRRDFMPFGEKVDDTVGERSNQALKYGQTEDNVRQKFTGYERDDETGLDFAQARMYNNQHARFTAVDPLLASGKSSNPQTFNRYVYVINSPLIYTDPNGLQATADKDEIEDGGSIPIATVYQFFGKLGEYLQKKMNRIRYSCYKGDCASKGNFKGSLDQGIRYVDYVRGGSPSGSSQRSGASPARSFDPTINPKTAPAFEEAKKAMDKAEPYIQNTPLLGSFYSAQKAGHEGRPVDFVLGLGSVGLDTFDIATFGGAGMVRRGAREGAEEGVEYMLKNLDDDLLFHYSNKSGIDGIMTTQQFKTGLKNRVHFTQNMYTPKEAENALFIGNPLYKGKADFLIAFRPKSNTQFMKVGDEIIHEGDVRFNLNQIIFSGPNPFKVGSN